MAAIGTWHLSTLAFCDEEIVEENNVVEFDHISGRQYYHSVDMNARYGEKYRWYLLHWQGPEELILLRQLDAAFHQGQSIHTPSSQRPSLIIFHDDPHVPLIFFSNIAISVLMRRNVRVSKLELLPDFLTRTCICT